jgi:hypothetical protein
MPIAKKRETPPAWRQGISRPESQAHFNKLIFMDFYAIKTATFALRFVKTVKPMKDFKGQEVLNSYFIKRSAEKRRIMTMETEEKVMEKKEDECTITDKDSEKKTNLCGCYVVDSCGCYVDPCCTPVTSCCC